MTELQTTGVVPEFDLGDRMRKALHAGGVSAGEMADYLGVRREAVSTWINGRITPKRGMVRLWAIRTGVSLEWLETGCAIRDLNPEPADLGFRSAWTVAA